MRIIAIIMLMLAYLILTIIDVAKGSWQTGVASFLLMWVNMLLFMSAR